MNSILKNLSAYASKKISFSTKADPEFINLSIGEPWFGPVPTVTSLFSDKSFTAQLPKELFSKYVESKGSLRLRELIAQRYKKLYGLSVNPQEEIIITHGGSEAFFLAILATTEPGDEVIIPDPTYMLYEPVCRILGRAPVRVYKEPESGFQLNLDNLIKSVSSKTKALVLNSPENPTGAVISNDNLHSLVKYCDHNGIYLLHDEVYDSFVHEGEHIPAINFNQENKTSLLINSFSKKFGLPGVRIGWLVAPSDLVSLASKVHDYCILSVNGLALRLAEEILSDVDVDSWVSNQSFEIKRRRDFLVEKLSNTYCFEFPGGTPGGGIFAFPKVTKLYELMPQEYRKTDSSVGAAVTEFLKQEMKIAVVPGDVYGDRGRDFIRIVLSVENSDLVRAISRIEDKYKSL